MALGIAFASFASYAISGFQTKFLRLLEPDFSPRTYIMWIGIINGTFYVAGTYFGAKLVDWRAKTDIRAYGTIPALSILAAFPLALAAFWAPSVALHLMIGAGLQLLSRRLSWAKLCYCANFGTCKTQSHVYSLVLLCFKHDSTWRRALHLREL